MEKVKRSVAIDLVSKASKRTSNVPKFKTVCLSTSSAIFIENSKTKIEVKSENIYLTEFEK